MDYRNQKPRGIPSKQSNRDLGQALHDWMEASLLIYANKGGTMGVFVRKSLPPGGHPASLDAANGEGAPLAQMGVQADEPPPRVRIAE